jgi:hypothetical protein
MKTQKIQDLPIGSKWCTNSGIEGILLEVLPGSADVIIMHCKKDWQGDNTMPTGRLRISNQTMVKELK